MLQLRNFCNISIKLYRQPVIRKITNHRHSFGIKASTVATHSPNYENVFAHTVLEANSKCNVLRGEQHETNVVVQSTEIDFDQNWENLTAGGIVESLETITNYCKLNGTTISDDRLDKFVDVCTERCFDFTDEQLIESLRILARYPLIDSPKSKNFFELLSALDDACVERIVAWDTSKILYVCDHWYMLYLGRFSKFNHRGVQRISRKIRSLPPHQLAQLAFYINLRRVQIVHMFQIENQFVKSMDDLSLNEIAVVCMGFFKTQATLRVPQTVEMICKRLIREIDTVESIALSCILKALRYSCSIYQIALVNQLLDAVNGQLPRLTSLTCLHVALIGTNLHVCHQTCIEQILHRFSDEVKSIRMKDFERISYVMGVFDFQSESNIEIRLCQQILAELKNRVDDIVKYPKCFARCLHYLTLKGYYDKEMISVALSTSFLSSAYGNQTNYDKELFTLDCFVKINLKKTYTGNELTEKNRQYMGKMFTESIPDRNVDHNATNKILMELKETFDELCHHSYLAHALPHFDRPDIIIAYDKRFNTGIDIAHNLPPRYSGKIIDRSMLLEDLNTDAEHVEIVNVIVAGWNNYVRDTRKLNGFIKQKIEQSKILGLHPILIPGTEWTRLQTGDRKHYLKYKLKMEMPQEKII